MYSGQDSSSSTPLAERNYGSQLNKFPRPYFNCQQGSPFLPEPHAAHERMVPCKICNETFTEFTISAHMTWHTGQRAFGCNLCNFCCDFEGYMRNHLRTEHGEAWGISFSIQKQEARRYDFSFCR